MNSSSQCDLGVYESLCGIVELDCELFDVMLGNTGEEEHSF